MFKKIRNIILSFSVMISFCMISNNAHAQMDPKIKALAMMAVYGTAGGAILGTASMAFGTNGRSIAQGASLGLYAGLLFGTYVIVSHSMKRNNYNRRDDDYYEPVPPMTLMDFKEQEIDKKRTAQSDVPLFYSNFLNLDF